MLTFFNIIFDFRLVAVRGVHCTTLPASTRGSKPTSTGSRRSSNSGNAESVQNKISFYLELAAADENNLVVFCL